MPDPLRIAVLLGSLPLVALVAGCSDDFLPGKPDPAHRPLPENRVLDFAALYRRNCAGCHGANGHYGPAPPLDDPIFLAIVPNDELLRVIEHGRPGTPMSAFAEEHGGTLTKAQVQVLAAGIKTYWWRNRSRDGRAPAFPKRCLNISRPARGVQGFRSRPGRGPFSPSLLRLPWNAGR